MRCIRSINCYSLCNTLIRFTNWTESRITQTSSHIEGIQPYNGSLWVKNLFEAVKKKGKIKRKKKRKQGYLGKKKKKNKQ